MELFEFVDSLFDAQKYKKCTNADKKKHFFMAQRYMSINYPIESNNFNKIGINYVAVMDTWNRILTKMFKTKPGWTYTKAIKTAKADVKDKVLDISDEAISFYLKRNKMDRRDFDFLSKIDNEGLYQDLKKIETHFKDSAK